MAAGMALEGKIVYINTIATFLTRRCFEQIVLDGCLHQTKIRLIASGGGLVYAPLGPTHQAIEDLALLRPLPNMHIFAPADAQEMRRLMPLTVDLPGPAYIRLGKGGDPVVTDPDQPFRVGQPYVLRPGKDLMIVSTGTASGVALDGAKLLAEKNIDAAVVHLPTLKPLDEEAFKALMAPMPAVITFEEHVRTGGVGSLVAEILAETRFPTQKRFARMGIPDAFCERYGSQASLMADLGLSPEAIAREGSALLQG
jgi:transketolase